MSQEAESGRTIVHDMRNQLAIAVAHLESWRDGKLQATPQRLGIVLAALEELNRSIDTLYALTRLADD